MVVACRKENAGADDWKLLAIHQSSLSQRIAAERTEQRRLNLLGQAADPLKTTRKQRRSGGDRTRLAEQQTLYGAVSCCEHVGVSKLM